MGDAGWQDHGEEEDFYEIFMGPDSSAKNAGRFSDNYIRTARYTLLTFIPINLFEQFRRFANFYFLLNALFSLLPDISPIGPLTSVTPLVFVLTISAIKDALEDYQRHLQDKEANATPYEVLRGGKLVSIESENIVPGDIVYVKKGEQFPADLVVLSTSGEGGACYVETSNLDGESNLKRRVTPSVTAHIKTLEQINDLKGEVICQTPSEELYKFRGQIYLDDMDNVPLSHNQLLLRGSKLRNTKWVYGVVVYAGADTKMYKNLKLSILKFSHLEARLNRIVLGVFAGNMSILFLCAIFAGIFQARQAKNMGYLGDVAHETPASVAGVHILTYFILFTYLIPISLFVTLELVRGAQAKLMEWDKQLCGYDDEGKAQPLMARNSSMNEELGMIEHIFSDKTGTLTRNIMVLKSWFINGQSYDHLGDSECLVNAQRDSPAEKPKIIEFLRAVALCNTVVPEVEENGDTSYEAQSPDEKALVEAAVEGGVRFARRFGTHVALEVNGDLEEYEILATLEFTAERKRMSVIVRTPDNAVKLYCKGADNVMFERLRKRDPLLEIVDEQVTSASDKEGLRTLVVAERELDLQAFLLWKKKFDEADMRINDRDEYIAAVCEEIEVKLNLIGATAVEDRLQDDVPETIQYLLDAGIHVWLLTGDKQETAENIGRSSSLVSQTTKLLRVNAYDSEMCGAVLNKHLGYLNSPDAAAVEAHAVVIDGDTLLYALTDFPRLFLKVGEMCKSVICCRVTPLQKALVVRLVKTEHRRVSLAIGDGANDVSMIQEADVGVGVIGREGTQAVRASDYAISEFRFLRRLLAVHGRYSYIRLGHLIQYSFYKNLAYIMPQFFYGFYSGFSGQVLYDEIIMSSFNIVWAATPPLFIGFFEKDVAEPVIDKYPQLYHELKNENIFNFRSMGVWALSAVYHAAVVFFVCVIGVMNYGQVYSNGIIGGQWVQAVFASTSAIFVILLKAGLTLRHWNFLTFLSTFGSIAGYLAFLMAYTGVLWSDFSLRMYNVGGMVFSTPLFYMCVALVVVIALTPDVIAKHYMQTYHPTAWQILRERYTRNMEEFVDLSKGIAAPRAKVVSELPATDVGKTKGKPQRSRSNKSNGSNNKRVAHDSETESAKSDGVGVGRTPAALHDMDIVSYSDGGP